GGSSIDPAVIDLLVSARQHAVSSPLPFLTPHEREVLAAISTGKNNSAATLNHRRNSEPSPQSRRDANPAAIRVLLVDDQDTFRRAAWAVVERTEGFVLAAEAAHA